MDRSSLITRGVIILVVVAVMAILVYPPRDTINLGLDLRGGLHLVLQVETDDAVRAETGTDADRLVEALADEGIQATYNQTGDSTFELSGVASDQDSTVRRVSDDVLFAWSSRRSADKLVFELDSQQVGTVRAQAITQAVETIRNRVDAFGVAEPSILQTGDRIVVQLPGVDDPDRVKRLIKNTAFLEFRLTANGVSPALGRVALIESLGGQVPEDVEIMEEEVRDENGTILETRYWALEKRRVITGRDLRNARPSTGEFGEPVVNFLLSRDGGEKFGDTTGANIGRQLAIILDNKVVSAPRIDDRITDSGIIRGGFTLEEVQDLSMVLRSGALPAGLTYLYERTVGPSLGRESIEKGQRAGLLGGALVLLTMLLVYKLSGFNAVTALLLNIVLVFGALAMLGATLTLPGIAGIVLTIGMAVDANVLIFERIREELRSGRTVKSAVSAGFGKAWSSIFDANITTLIAATFLFTFGTGPIRGFAVTLSVGILASLFTAVFVSRWVFDLYLSRRQRVDQLSI